MSSFIYDTNSFNEILRSISAVILLSNSFINGIIYSWMSPKFRDEARSFLMRYLLKRNTYGNRPSHSPTEVSDVPTPEMREKTLRRIDRGRNLTLQAL